MCILCQTEPVYEFTNQRKLCKNCFINWFNKKSLYTIRKFRMIERGDKVKLQENKTYSGVVLEKMFEILEEKGVIEIVKKGENKIALSSTTDSESNKIIETIIKKRTKDLRECSPKSTKYIKPLYLFLDKEILLYAKLKKLKFKKIKKNKPQIEEFLDKLERKHPEVKRAVVNSYLELYN